MQETESGFIGKANVAGPIDAHITDVEVLRVSQVNVVARGRRYGRLWLLKGLAPELRDSTGGRRRMMKEFEVHSRLCHPSVVQAVNIEDVDGLGPCIVMEWVEGKTLSDLLHEGTLTKRERQGIMRDIVAAVGYLHRSGVVHRDLKPSNIMVRSAGHEVVIIDFGLADTDSYVELKQAAGTLGFISPEQLEKGGSDPADDVYSLGVIMNEVCPEYRRLARRCTASRKARPADANELLRLIDKRNRPKRFMIYTALAIALMAAAAIGGKRIMALDEAARQSDLRVDSLKHENMRNADYATQLSDSLSRVHSRMLSAEDELNRTKEYDALYKRLYDAGCSKIDAKIKYYEETTLPKVDPLYLSTSLQDFDSRLRQEIHNMSKSFLTEGLDNMDVQRLEGELMKYYDIQGQRVINKVNNLVQEWIRK